MLAKPTEALLQAPFSCTPEVLKEIETALSTARLRRYLNAAGGDPHLALRLYVWNARLCEELYLPLQTAEICIRNVVHYTLTRKYGPGWYSNHKFIDVLPDRYKEEVARTVRDEQNSRMGAFTVDHVVAGMKFGFWVHLLTKNFQHLLWQQGMGRSFPNISPEVDREQVYTQVDRLRSFRNKVMHHYAIFDRHVLDEHANAMDIIRWTSEHLHWFARQLVNPQAAMAKKPRV
jgi:hypothetical protein